MNTKISNKSSNDTDDSDDTNDEDDINWTGNIINNKYLILNKLGYGSYCTVWNTYDIETKKLIALKIYNLEDTDDGIYEKNILDELKKLAIPNSILYDKSIEFIYDDDKYIAFTMQNCGYSLNEIRKLFRDIIRTDIDINLQYITFINKSKNNLLDILKKLHDTGYAHTDIKPENILIDIPRLESKIIYEQILNTHDKIKKIKNKKITLELSNMAKQYNSITINDNDVISYLSRFDYNIKLCDFGTCLKFNDNTIYKKHTSYYKSPHIILKYPLTKDYDFWSLGCTLYELITGVVLFNPFDETLIDEYDDIEDINLMYLITSTIGMPPIDFINKSKVADVIFTFDRKAIRGFKKIMFNDYIKNLLSLETTINKNILFQLITEIKNYLVVKCV